MNVWEIPFPAVTICPMHSTSNTTNLIVASWKGKDFNPNEIFIESGEYQNCYTFNMMNFKDSFYDDV